MNRAIHRIASLMLLLAMILGNYSSSRALSVGSTPPLRSQGDSTICLFKSGPLITISSDQTTYANKSLAAFTRIDASHVIFTDNKGQPIRIAGPDICWFGGWVKGGYPYDTAWNTTHPTFGIAVYDGSPRAIVEGIRIEHIGDGIKIRQGENSGQAGIAEPIIVRGVWLRDIRDDCIESDWQIGVNIEDSLLDGCYTAFAAQKRDSDIAVNGSNNVWEITNTLVYMHDQIGVFKGISPGHSEFFKWDATAPKIKIYNSIFRVDSADSESDNQFNFHTDKITDCANNILVWLGPGPFPGIVPSCFRITTHKAVWDNAVTSWKIRHGYKSTTKGWLVEHWR